MANVKKVEFDGITYRVTAAANTPDRDAMAEVAKLIGMQPTPMIMEAQGYDWQTSFGCGFTRFPVVSGDCGDSGDVRGDHHVPACAGDKGGKAG